MPEGVCLLGSSNIRLWTTLPDDFPELNIVNRGVGGPRLADLAGFAPRLVVAAQPRVIVVSGRGGQGLRLIDANSAFLDSDGKPAPECFLDDQQHPSPTGNAGRAAIMRPLLEEMLRETPVR